MKIEGANMTSPLSSSELEQICFQMISYGGSAKSDFLEAVELAKAGKIEEAKRKVEEAEAAYLKAHDAHFGLIQEDAQSADGFLTRLILVHAEDQLSSAETVRLLSGQLIDMYRCLWEKGVLS